MTYTAWDLEDFARDCGYDGPPFRWDEERRFLLRCELDAAYFHLYGIKRDDVDYIMETFPIVKRKDEKEYGEYRTKRVILEMYDAMAQRWRRGRRMRHGWSRHPRYAGSTCTERDNGYTFVGGYRGNMTAIWQNDGSGWHLLSPQGFPNEATLHTLVENAPHLLPLAGTPRLIVLGREVQLGSGRADLLAIEPNGRLSIIEIKLARNAEARRAVIAQVLAYAAYLWGMDAATLEQRYSTSTCMSVATRAWHTRFNQMIRKAHSMPKRLRYRLPAI